MTKKHLWTMLGLFALFSTVSVNPASAKKADNKDKSPMILIKTSMGNITVELDEKNAPISSKNFLDYVKAKHYDGTVFHRVIKGFMIQGGGMDKDLNVKAGSKEKIQNEAGNGLKNLNGTLAMARTNDPNSATDQFFINVKDNGFLDHRNDSPGGFGYAVFGKVTDGMDVVKKIEETATTTKGPYADVPETPVVIESMTVKK